MTTASEDSPPQNLTLVSTPVRISVLVLVVLGSAGGDLTVTSRLVFHKGHALVEPVGLAIRIYHLIGLFLLLLIMDAALRESDPNQGSLWKVSSAKGIHFPSAFFCLINIFQILLFESQLKVLCKGPVGPSNTNRIVDSFFLVP